MSGKSRCAWKTSVKVELVVVKVVSLMSQKHCTTRNCPLSLIIQFISKAPFTLATMSKQRATMLKQRSTLSKQRSTLLPVLATVLNEFFAEFRLFDKVETN